MIYLYIKTHNITGLKYFGKTTKSDPEAYRGSGKYWKRHIAAHGYDVTTEILGAFEDEAECTLAAVIFSRENDIVASEEWANLREENGLDGAPLGAKGAEFSPEVLEVISQKSKENWSDASFRDRIIQSQKDSWTKDRKAKNSEMMKDKWTEERRRQHSELMASKEYNPNFRRTVTTDEHKEKIAQALKGKPKSEEHCKKLAAPKNRVCRIEDRKEMAVGHFSRWLKKVIQP